MKAEQGERHAHAQAVNRRNELARLASLQFAAVLVHRTQQLEDALRLIASEEAEAIGVRGIRMLASLALGGAVDIPKVEDTDEIKSGIVT